MSDWDILGTVKQDIQGTSWIHWTGTSLGRLGDKYLAAGDLICNKIADKITIVSKKSSVEKSKKSHSEDELEVPKKRYRYAEERQQIIDKLGQYNNMIMKYQKITSLLDNASNQSSKFRTKNQVEINDESKVGYTTGSDINFKAISLRSSLCYYADAYILFKGTIIITGAEDNAAARQADERNKGVIFKNSVPFTKSISKVNDTEINNARDIDIVVEMYNLIEYCDNYSKTSGSFWHRYKDGPSDNLVNSESFKSKVKIIGSTPAGGKTKDVKIIVLLK